MILSIEEFTKESQGYWINQPPEEIAGICIGLKNSEQGFMMVETLPEYWGSAIPNSHRRFTEKVQAGISCFMMEKSFVETTDQLPDQPILVVKNTFEAFKRIAIAIREASTAKRVQVTGSEGKTGFKYALNYLISQQADSYAQETSANLTAAIFLSFSRLKPETEYTVIEISCPQPNRCSQRSRIIQPDLAVITNLNISHMNTHGSVEKLIQHKAESLDGLKPGGKCLINEDTGYYTEFMQYMQGRKDVSYITYSYQNEQADGNLIKQTFGDLGWDVEARIAGVNYQYRVNRIQEHWPLTSVGILVAIHELGLDVEQATQDFKTFNLGWDSMGEINFHALDEQRQFLFYDQHFSITETALKSALNDVSRIQVEGKKIAVISGEHNSDHYAGETHQRIAKHIDASDIDLLFTVGEYAEGIVNALEDDSIFQGHFFKIEQLSHCLINRIAVNDLLFIKGMTKLNFRYLSDKINQRFHKI